jgi:type I restriction enzyme S subunit
VSSFADEIIHLRNAGSWSGGGTPSKANADFWDNGDIPWVSPKDMKTFELHDSQDKITAKAVEASPAKLVPAGSVLMVVRSGILAHTFPVAIARRPVTLNQDMKAITPKSGLSSEFLAYQLRAQASTILNSCTKSGTTVASVETKQLQALPIWVPSTELQSKIVEELDKQLSRLGATVITLQGIQAKLKQARASILKAAVEGMLETHEKAVSSTSVNNDHIQIWEHEIKILKQKSMPSNRDRRRMENEGLLPSADEHGWIQATVSEIGTVQLGRQRSPKDHHGPWMTPYLRAANITWEGFSLEDIKSMNFNPAEREKFALKAGDILLNEASGSASEVGKPAFWRGEISDCCFQNTLIRVRTIPALQRWAWLHFLADAKSGWFSRSSKGVGIHHLSANTLSAHTIRIPPPQQQERILAEVDRRFSVLDQVEATVTASLARCGKLRQAILKRTFRG